MSIILTSISHYSMLNNVLNYPSISSHLIQSHMIINYEYYNLLIITLLIDYIFHYSHSVAIYSIFYEILINDPLISLLSIHFEQHLSHSLSISEPMYKSDE